MNDIKTQVSNVYTAAVKPKSMQSTLLKCKSAQYLLCFKSDEDWINAQQNIIIEAMIMLKSQTQKFENFGLLNIP